MNCAFALVTREAREFWRRRKIWWRESRDSRFLDVSLPYTHRYPIPINTDYSILKLVLSSFHSDVSIILRHNLMRRAYAEARSHTKTACNHNERMRRQRRRQRHTPIDDTISNKYLYLYVYYMHYMLSHSRNTRKSRRTYIFIIIINFNWKWFWMAPHARCDAVAHVTHFSPL